MRVTSNMMTNMLTRNICRQSEALYKAQTVVSSGKKISKPSDDPIAAGNILNYRSQLSSIDQYKSNIDDGKIWIEQSETALNAVDDSLREIKAIAAEQAAGSTENRETALEQIRLQYDQVFSMANTACGDQYLFGGFETGTAPFTRDSAYTATYNGDDGNFSIAAGEGMQIPVNATGTDVFTGEGTSGGVNLVDTLQGIITALENPDTEEGSRQIDALMADLGTALDQVEQAGASQAVIYQRLESQEEILNGRKTVLEDMLYKTEYEDMDKAAIELQTQKTSYETTIAASGNILSKKSLVDYLA